MPDAWGQVHCAGEKIPRQRQRKLVEPSGGLRGTFLQAVMAGGQLSRFTSEDAGLQGHSHGPWERPHETCT